MWSVMLLVTGECWVAAAATAAVRASCIPLFHQKFFFFTWVFHVLRLLLPVVYSYLVLLIVYNNLVPVRIFCRRCPSFYRF